MSSDQTDAETNPYYNTFGSNTNDKKPIWCRDESDVSTNIDAAIRKSEKIAGWKLEMGEAKSCHAVLETKCNVMV